MALLFGLLDGELSYQDVITAWNSVAPMLGKGEKVEVFTEIDGDVHIILSADLLKKFKINI